MRSLFVSDLDGTLLTNAGTLSEFTRRTLEELIDEGMLFTVASARHVISIRNVFRGLKLPLPVVDVNGSFLSDLETGRHEFVHSIERGLAEAIYRLLPGFGCVPFVATFNGHEDRVYYSRIINGGMAWFLEDRRAARDERLRYTDDLARSLDEEVICLTIIGERDRMAEVERAIRDTAGGEVVTHYFENAYSPGWYWVTVHDRRATKDQAIKALMERYGLAGAELVVFGDQENDVGMFEVADRAIAVANAAEEIKMRATAVIGSNEEDSVAGYLLAQWRSRGDWAV